MGEGAGRVPGSAVNTAEDTKDAEPHNLFTLRPQPWGFSGPSLTLAFFRNLPTSSAVGMEGWAPLRVTESAATAQAKVAASTGLLPCSKPTASAPLKASPAAVESTARTL